MIKIISFSGPPQSGKDTSLDILRNAGLFTKKVSFAQNLKSICSTIFCLPMEMFNDPELKDKNFDFSKPLTMEHINQVVAAAYELWPFTPPPTKELKKFEGMIFSTPRHLLQTIGTDLIRDTLDKTWHINALLTNLNPDFDGVYVATDVRFFNELTSLKDKFKKEYLSIYILRPEKEKLISSNSKKSEKSALSLKDKCDFFLINNNLDEYKEELITVLSKRGVFNAR